MNDAPYLNVVGQTAAKKQMALLLDSYQHTRYLQPLLFVAPKGGGKTTMARETARQLTRFDTNGATVLDATTQRPVIKPLLTVNCSTLTSVNAFVNGFILPKVQDRDVTVLFDEASEIPHKISMAMLDIFNTTDAAQGYKTKLSHDIYEIEFDGTRQTFLFCTSEPDKLFHALENRLERIALAGYTHAQYAQIISQKLPSVQFEDGVLAEIATVIRDNGRIAHKMAIKISQYLKDRTRFSSQDWETLKDILNIHPLGLDDIEIQILNFLAHKHSGTSLTSLSAKTGMTRTALQKDTEMFLQKHGLMEVTTTGRQITPFGIDYLKSLKNTEVLA